MSRILLRSKAKLASVVGLAFEQFDSRVDPLNMPPSLTNPPPRDLAGRRRPMSCFQSLDRRAALAHLRGVTVDRVAAFGLGWAGWR